MALLLREPRAEGGSKPCGGPKPPHQQLIMSILATTLGGSQLGLSGYLCVPHTYAGQEAEDGGLEGTLGEVSQAASCWT